MSTAMLNPMTAAEAREACQDIRDGLSSVRRMVFDLYAREGWRALKYSSWRECVLAEFPDDSQSKLYRQLAAAQCEINISPRGEIGTIPEKVLRPIAGQDKQTQKDAWRLAVANALEDDPTSAEVYDAVEKIKKLTAEERVEAISKAEAKIEKDHREDTRKKAPDYRSVCEAVISTLKRAIKLAQNMPNPDEMVKGIDALVLKAEKQKEYL